MKINLLSKHGAFWQVLPGALKHYVLTSLESVPYQISIREKSCSLLFYLRIKKNINDRLKYSLQFLVFLLKTNPYGNRI